MEPYAIIILLLSSAVVVLIISNLSVRKQVERKLARHQQELELL